MGDVYALTVCFSPVDRDLGIATRQSGSATGDRCLGFSPVDRDLGIATGHLPLPEKVIESFSPVDRDLGIATIPHLICSRQIVVSVP